MIVPTWVFMALAASMPPVPVVDPALPHYRACTAMAGTLTGSASDITYALVDRWQGDFQRLQPGIIITIDHPAGPPQANLNPGLRAFIAGARDFAVVSRDLSDTDAAAFIAAHGHPPLRIAVAGGSWNSFGFLDPVVFVVNDANPLKRISQSQLAKLFGRDPLTRPVDWARLGLPTWRGRAVHVVGGSAWRGAYSARAQVVRERILLGRNPLRDDLDTGSEADVPSAVASDPLAIGFTGLGHVTLGSHVLAIATDGHSAAGPTFQNVVNGRYPLARTVNLYLADAKVSPQVRALLSYLRSIEGQSIVAASPPFLPLRANAKISKLTASLQVDPPQCSP